MELQKYTQSQSLFFLYSIRQLLILFQEKKNGLNSDPGNKS